MSVAKSRLFSFRPPKQSTNSTTSSPRGLEHQQHSYQRHSPHEEGDDNSWGDDDENSGDGHIPYQHGDEFDEEEQDEHQFTVDQRRNHSGGSPHHDSGGASPVDQGGAVGSGMTRSDSGRHHHQVRIKRKSSSRAGGGAGGIQSSSSREFSSDHGGPFGNGGSRRSTGVYFNSLQGSASTATNHQPHHRSSVFNSGSRNSLLIPHPGSGEHISPKITLIADEDPQFSVEAMLKTDPKLKFLAKKSPLMRKASVAVVDASRQRRRKSRIAQLNNGGFTEALSAADPQQDFLSSPASNYNEDAAEDDHFRPGEDPSCPPGGQSPLGGNPELNGSAFGAVEESRFYGSSDGDNVSPEANNSGNDKAHKRDITISISRSQDARDSGEENSPLSTGASPFPPPGSQRRSVNASQDSQTGSGRSAGVTFPDQQNVFVSVPTALGDNSPVATAPPSRNASFNMMDNNKLRPTKSSRSMSRKKSAVDERLEKAKLNRAVTYINDLYTKVARRELRERRRQELHHIAETEAAAADQNLTKEEAWLSLVQAALFFDASFSSMASKISARRQLSFLLIPLIRKALLRREKANYIAHWTSKERTKEQRVVMPGVVELCKMSPIFAKWPLDHLAKLQAVAKPVCFFENECVVFAGENSRQDAVYLIVHGECEEVERGGPTAFSRGRTPQQTLKHKDSFLAASLASVGAQAYEKHLSPTNSTRSAAAIDESSSSLVHPLGASSPRSLNNTTNTISTSGGRGESPNKKSRNTQQQGSTSPLKRSDFGSTSSLRSSGTNATKTGRGASPAGGSQVVSRSVSPAWAANSLAADENSSPRHHSNTNAPPPDHHEASFGESFGLSKPLGGKRTELFKKGSVIGEGRILLSETYTHSIRCDSTVLAFAISSPDYLKLVDELPSNVHTDALHAAKAAAKKRVIKWCPRPTADELMAGSPILAQCSREAVGQLAVCLAPIVAKPGERIIRDVFTSKKILCVHSGVTRLVEDLPLEQVLAKKMKHEPKPPGSQPQSRGETRDGQRSTKASPTTTPKEPSLFRRGSGAGVVGSESLIPRAPTFQLSENQTGRPFPPGVVPAALSGDLASRGGSRRTSLTQDNSSKPSTREGGSRNPMSPASPPSAGPTTIRNVKLGEVIGLESTCMTHLPPLNGNEVSLIADSFTVVWSVARDELLSIATRMDLNHRLITNTSRQIYVPEFQPGIIRSTPIFSFLTEKAAQRVLSSLSVRVTVPELVFVREGVLLSEAFIVVAGVVQLCVQERRPGGIASEAAAAAMGSKSLPGVAGGVANDNKKTYRRVVGELTAGMLYGFPELLAEQPSPHTLVCPHSAVVLVGTRNDILSALAHGKNHNLMLSIVEKAEVLSGAKQMKESEKAKLESAIVAENQQRADDQRVIFEAQRRSAMRAKKVLQANRAREEDAKPLRQETITRHLHYRQRALQMQQLSVEHRVFAAFQKQLHGDMRTKDERAHDEYFKRPYDVVKPLYYDRKGQLVEGRPENDDEWTGSEDDDNEDYDSQESGSWYDELSSRGSESGDVAGSRSGTAGGNTFVGSRGSSRGRHSSRKLRRRQLASQGSQRSYHSSGVSEDDDRHSSVSGSKQQQRKRKKLRFKKSTKDLEMEDERPPSHGTTSSWRARRNRRTSIDGQNSRYQSGTMSPKGAQTEKMKKRKDAGLSFSSRSKPPPQTHWTSQEEDDDELRKKKQIATKQRERLVLADHADDSASNASSHGRTSSGRSKKSTARQRRRERKKAGPHPNSYFTLGDDGALLWIRGDRFGTTTAAMQQSGAGTDTDSERSSATSKGTKASGKKGSNAGTIFTTVTNATSGPSLATLVSSPDNGYTSTASVPYDTLNNPEARIKNVPEPPVLYPKDPPKPSTVIDMMMKEYKERKDREKATKNAETAARVKRPNDAGGGGEPHPPIGAEKQSFSRSCDRDIFDVESQGAQSATISSLPQLAKEFSFNTTSGAPTPRRANQQVQMVVPQGHPTTIADDEHKQPQHPDLLDSTTGSFGMGPGGLNSTTMGSTSIPPSLIGSPKNRQKQLLEEQARRRRATQNAATGGFPSRGDRVSESLDSVAKKRKEKIEKALGAALVGGRRSGSAGSDEDPYALSASFQQVARLNKQKNKKHMKSSIGGAEPDDVPLYPRPEPQESDAIRDLLSMASLNPNRGKQLIGKFHVGSGAEDELFLVAGQRRLEEMPTDPAGVKVLGPVTPATQLKTQHEAPIQLGDCKATPDAWDAAFSGPESLQSNLFPQFQHKQPSYSDENVQGDTKTEGGIAHESTKNNSNSDGGRRFWVKKGQLDSTKHRLQLIKRQIDRATRDMEPLNRRQLASIRNEEYRFGDNSVKRPVPKTARVSSSLNDISGGQDDQVLLGSDHRDDLDAGVPVAPLTCRKEYTKKPFKHHHQPHQNPETTRNTQHQNAKHLHKQHLLVVKSSVSRDDDVAHAPHLSDEEIDENADLGNIDALHLAAHRHRHSHQHQEQDQDEFYFDDNNGDLHRVMPNGEDYVVQEGSGGAKKKGGPAALPAHHQAMIDQRLADRNVSVVVQHRQLGKGANSDNVGNGKEAPHHHQRSPRLRNQRSDVPVAYQSDAQRRNPHGIVRSVRNPAVNDPPEGDEQHQRRQKLTVGCMSVSEREAKRRKTTAAAKTHLRTTSRDDDDEAQQTKQKSAHSAFAMKVRETRDGSGQ